MSFFKSFTLLLSLAGVVQAYAASPNRAVIEHIANLPAAPEGYKWVVNERFCDEFDGNELNENLWHKKSPHWVNGRPPATFKAEAVSVKDGYLRLTNYVLDAPEGNDGKPGDKYYYAGGAVASKSESASYGYYETSMKASQTSMSSTFWLKVHPTPTMVANESGESNLITTYQEIDIIETMGVITPETIENGAGLANWGSQMNSNVWYGHRVDNAPSQPGSAGQSVDIERVKTDPSAEDFHRYGCWWVDAHTVKLYYDGEYMFTIKASTEFSDTPLEHPMFMHLVTETYDWAPGVSPEQLADKEKATTLYDWVRSYRLVKE